jgi:hypothetical protein
MHQPYTNKYKQDQSKSDLSHPFSNKIEDLVSKKMAGYLIWYIMIDNYNARHSYTEGM